MGATVNDAVNVTATGLTPLASVANTASETDTGTAQTVTVGSVITIGETFTTGNAAGYTSALSCTGTSGLSGNVLTVGASDTAIVCTETNTRKTATITLAKTWVGATVNDAVNVTATGLTPLASVANTASETDTGTAQTVTVGSVITIGETFTTGNMANYSSSYSCSNALAGGQSPSGTGNSFSVTPAEGDVLTCIFLNQGTAVDLQVIKTANPTSVQKGGITTYTMVFSNNGPIAANGAVMRDSPAPGLDCTVPSTVATCSAAGGATCPGSTIPVGSLTSSAGVAIPVFPSGGTVTLTMQCTVNGP
ncbi:putative repeat protein (TIGR01451 family) [Variovorax boronicumulans]|nr:putative repeat protein (TIGR01451 family) [Variovorax boronicumulans]